MNINMIFNFILDMWPAQLKAYYNTAVVTDGEDCLNCYKSHNTHKSHKEPNFLQVPPRLGSFSYPYMEKGASWNYKNDRLIIT